jgi:chitin synthase
LNGSFFAAIHATVKFGYLYRSDHTFIRKFWLHIELVYQLFQQLFAWVSLANFFIAFVSGLSNFTKVPGTKYGSFTQSVLTKSLQDPSFGLPWAKYVNIVLHYIYLGLLVSCSIGCSA